MLHIGLLGRLDVVCDGQPVELAGPRTRDLLAVLALSPGRPITAEDLIGRCWDESHAADPRASLHAAVRRLRVLLGDGAIRTDGNGYRLDVADGSVDAVVFQGLLTGSAPAGREAVEHALGLWRGTPFAPESCRWLREVEQPRLIELHLSAVERRADLDLAGTSPSGVERSVRELREQAARHPLREPLWARLMAALDRSGRRAEALSTYATVRERIGDTLGVEPGCELRAAFQALLRNDVPDETVAAGRTPQPEPAVLRTLPVPRQLPRATPAFQGRADLMRRLDELTAARATDEPSTVIVLSGLGGVGKTSLAVHWGHRRADRFAEGCLFADLSGFGPGDPAQPGAVAASMLHALGLSSDSIPRDTAGRSGLLRSRLAGRPVLMVLDNARDAEQVRPLLPSTGAVVLVTSRSRLRGLVSRDGAHAVGVAALTTEEATRFLTVRMAARPDAEEDGRRRLAQLCSGLPLALAVAAEQAVSRPGDGLSDLVAELAGAPARLDVLAGDEPAADVASVLQWSYDALDAESAEVFRLVGLTVVGTFCASGAAALTDRNVATTRRTLGHLVDLSLLGSAGHDRYRQHDLVREFAATTALRQDGAAACRAAQERQLEWCIHTAHAAKSRFAPEVGSLEKPPAPDLSLPVLRFAAVDDARGWYVAEAPALCQAVFAAVDAGHDLLATRLGVVLWNHLATRATPAEAIEVQQAVLAAAQRANDELLVAVALNQLGTAHGMAGRLDECATLLHRAHRHFARIGSQRGRGVVHLNLGTLASRSGNNDGAIEHATTALDIARRQQHASSIGTALNNLADAHRRRGEFDIALGLAEEGLAVVESHRNTYLLSFLLDTLGQIVALRGDPVRAADLFARAAEHDLRQQRPRAAAEHLVRLGDALHQHETALHQHETALHQHERALQRHRTASAAVDAWQRALALIESMPAVPHTFDEAALRTRLDGAPPTAGGGQPKKTSASA